jgi:Anticodon binding domain
MPEPSAESPIVSAPQWTRAQLRAILCEGGWLGKDSPSSAPPAPADAALDEWVERAAALLGPHAADRPALAGLLQLIFRYDAAAVLRDPENQAVLMRTGAREVVRELANRVLEGSEIDSDRFKEIVDGIKAVLPYRSRALFHPIRVALAGRAGEGELDRVILLLDGAAKLNLKARAKGARQRMLEFCAALD